ncbi:hypothetical protein PUN28_002860 [Cardiocondyla obscurior]|uniref:Uncharacterized protein n=1 Tax=Cardiocondyla obscurior TaxID=286306 RepID=A0AAW2GWC2_9HYME
MTYIIFNSYFKSFDFNVKIIYRTKLFFTDTKYLVSHYPSSICGIFFLRVCDCKSTRHLSGRVEFNSVRETGKVPRKTLTTYQVGKTHVSRERDRNEERERKREEEEKRQSEEEVSMLAIARIKDVSTFSSDRHHFIRSPSANKCFPSAEAVALKIRRVQPVCHEVALLAGSSFGIAVNLAVRTTRDCQSAKSSFDLLHAHIVVHIRACAAGCSSTTNARAFRRVRFYVA